MVWGFAVHHYTHQQHSCLPFRCQALLPTLVTIFSDPWTTLMHVFPQQRSFLLMNCLILQQPKKMLSTKIENKQFQLLFDASSIPNRACLMSASSNLAASWLSVIPSPGLNLHLDTAEFQTVLKWWLVIDRFGSSRCHLLQPSR